MKPAFETHLLTLGKSLRHEHDNLSEPCTGKSAIPTRYVAGLYAEGFRDSAAVLLRETDNCDVPTRVIIASKRIFVRRVHLTSVYRQNSCSAVRGHPLSMPSNLGSGRRIRTADLLVMSQSS